jgi:hypothetical protein
VADHRGRDRLVLAHATSYPGRCAVATAIRAPLSLRSLRVQARSSPWRTRSGSDGAPDHSETRVHARSTGTLYASNTASRETIV